MGMFNLLESRIEPLYPTFSPEEGCLSPKHMAMVAKEKDEWERASSIKLLKKREDIIHSASEESILRMDL